MTDLFGPGLPAQGVTDRPGETRVHASTDTWYKDCTAPELNDGTSWESAAMNAVLGMLRSIARGNGNTAAAAAIVPEENDEDAILLNSIKFLIQRNLPTYATVDTGSANQVILAPSPAMPEYKTGAPIRFIKMASSNDDEDPTINISGLGNKVMKHADGSTIKEGDLPGSGYFEGVYDGTNMRITVGARKASSLQKAAFPETVEFTTPGAWSWTPPAGVTRCRVHLIGAGGGGGTGSFGNAGGAGGGGGGYSRKDIDVVPGVAIGGNLGSGGAGGPVNTTTAGSGGGATTCTSHHQAGGGGGGEAAVGNQPGTPTSSAGGVGSSGDINFTGSFGGSGANTITPGGTGAPYSTGYGGPGGSAPGPFGGANSYISTGSGSNGIGPGCGGSGGGGNSGINAGAGSGSNGYVLIEYVEP